MATWKKVIVSGSNAELNQLIITSSIAQQVITTNPATTTLTGSFNGAFVGNGSGLTNVNATSLNVDTISQIGQASDQLFVSQSDGIKRITYQNFLTDLVNANDSNLEVDGNTDGIKLKANINVTQVTASVISASTYIGLPAFQTPASLTNGSGIDTLSFNGSTTTSVRIKSASVFADNVILKWDTGGNQFESSSLSDNGNGVVSGGSSIQLTGSNSILTGSFTGSFKGDGSGLTGVGVTVTDNATGNILFATGTNSVLSGSAKLSYDQGNEILSVTKEIKFSASAAGSTAVLSGFGNIATASIFTGANVANVVQIGNTTSTTFIGNDLIINGDLIANGSSSFINTQNLLVSDKFITLASSSAGNTDGGIIIQNSLSPAGTGSGFAFYLETATTPRWAVTSSLNLNATGGSADEYMVTAKIAAGVPTGNPTWGGSTAGAGNMYINTDDQSIWIYS